MRVIHSLAYIIVSITSLVFSLVVKLYPLSHWYYYLLIGGGGPCINSIAMILELLVLKSELIKERPYTPGHIHFFIFVALFSIARFIVGVVTTDDRAECITNQVLNGVLMLISIIQLFYWIIKRQSLPEFINPKIKMEMEGLDDNLIGE